MNVLPPYVFKGRAAKMIAVRVRIKKPAADAPGIHFYPLSFFRCEHFWTRDWKVVRIQKGFVDRLKRESILEVEEVH
ncbi:hypothetical protein [Candidatus Ferrigenium straubiae]|jgi:hypothetical protein|uniref:hypothetical protein n=1 Tax=Candidatus Ferrigenium straubiae TaxID=2919506 RepID=UPI003F4ABBA1